MGGLCSEILHPAPASALTAKGEEQTIIAQSPQLPTKIAATVIQDLAQKTRIPLAKLKIVAATPQTWPNGCLGLPKPKETCTPSPIKGWQIGVSDGARLWTYRTNNTGTQLRAENLKSPQTFLPSRIVEQALADAARRSDLDPSQLQISSAVPKVWSDGCLGLGGLNVLCTEALVPGWQVVVQSDRQRWVYRTNQSGSLVVLDQAGSKVVGQMIQPPRTIPTAELPEALTPDTVFRVISVSSINNRVSETNLMADGQIYVTEANLKGVPETRQIQQISPEIVSKFQELLVERRFARFNLLDYPAPDGAAGFTMFALSSSQATVRFADVSQFQLSADIQEILKVWDKLKRRGRF